MSGTELVTAMEAAVARMERNRNAVAVPGTETERRPVMEVALHPTTGAAMIPAAPRVPPPGKDLASALSIARAAGTQCYAVVASAEARQAAEGYAASLHRLLHPVADPDLIREWLARWAPRCRRQSGDDYSDFERDVIFALEDVSAIAFCVETAKLAAQEPRFEWLPSPRAIHALLAAWLAPHHASLEAARKVAVAEEPEPPAREAANPRPITEQEIAERRAAVAATMAKHRAIMEARRSDDRVFGSRPKPKPSTYAPYFHVVSLRDTLVNGGCEPKHRPAMTTRLAALLKTHPDVAEEIQLSAEDVVAGALDGAFALPRKRTTRSP